MKQFYLTLIFLSVNLLVCAQENAGIPVKDITIIKRVDDSSETGKTVSTSKAASTARILTTPTTPTGSSTEVGITEGQLTVSLNGIANYSIPISVPPGINGVEPQISLDYNSQNGLTGTATTGWDIGGISTITRIPSTKFHDGKIDPVDFDALDRFAFEGQRLIVKNGTGGVYGAEGTVYETEYFSNLKITSFGVHPGGANYGPAYFIVEYPDGSKAYYGNSTDSRSVTDWSITYWENPQGARISYDYITSDNSLYINAVKYGSLTTSTPINEVKFTYSGTRSTPEIGYIGGIYIKKDKKLTEIKVLSNGTGFRNYVIDSDFQLKSITEKSGDGTKSYNPTLFTYGGIYYFSTNDISYQNATTSLNVGNISTLNAATVSGDFDADGKMDFLLYPITGTDAKKKYWFYSNIASGTTTNMGVEHAVGAFEDIFPTTWLSWNNKIMPQGWTVAKKNRYKLYFYCL